LDINKIDDRHNRSQRTTDLRALQLE
jgi:hypothetical protein